MFLNIFLRIHHVSDSKCFWFEEAINVWVSRKVTKCIRAARAKVFLSKTCLKERSERKCICSKETPLRVGEFRSSRAVSIWRLQSCAAFICTLQNWMIVFPKRWQSGCIKVNRVCRCTCVRVCVRECMWVTLSLSAARRDGGERGRGLRRRGRRGNRKKIPVPISRSCSRFRAEFLSVQNGRFLLTYHFSLQKWPFVTFEERSERKMAPLAPGCLWAATSLFESDQWSLFNREVDVKWLQLSRGRRDGRLLLLEFYASLGFEPSSITSNSEIPPLHHAEPWSFRGGDRV